MDLERGGSASWSATGAVTLTSSHEITLNGNGCVITLSGSSNYCFGNNAATVFTINMGTTVVAHDHRDGIHF